MKPQIEIVRSTISKEKFSLRISNSRHGAEIIFCGVVRDRNHGKKVNAVSYDAFVPLAEKSFFEISYEAQAKWGPDLSIAISHRIGKLEVGDVSLAIGVGSPHRREAYEASSYILEEIKARSPIWKKEHYDDGETQWLLGHTLCNHAEVG